MKGRGADVSAPQREENFCRACSFEQGTVPPVPNNPSPGTTKGVSRIDAQVPNTSTTAGCCADDVGGLRRLGHNSCR